MVRVKRGKISLKRRRNVLKQTKGFRHASKSKERMAKEALAHAGTHAYRHRRQKKRDFRKLWNIKINAGARKNGISYSVFMDKLKKNRIVLDRKILAELAEKNPEIFAQIIERVK
ncbi:MAG: 50S ribosomal protein L20 [Patescibacteria group bacterium]|nr:50S ribosomal protein L20 [Patescibacteria group bacterium]